MNKYLGDRWEDFEKEIMTLEEIEESNARVDLMCQLASLREKVNLTQKDISERTGIAQSVISKMESGRTSPRVETFVNALAAIGYHIEIVANE